MSTGSQSRVRAYVAALDRRRESPAAELADELAPLRGLAPSERGAWVASVSRSAWAILRSRRDAEHVIRSQEPPAPDFYDVRRALARRRSGR